MARRGAKVIELQKAEKKSESREARERACIADIAAALEKHRCAIEPRLKIGPAGVIGAECFVIPLE